MPIATERLRAVLEWLRLDAAGEKKPLEALVFSDETSEPVGSFRTAWVSAVLKAHDVELVWMKDAAWRNLTPECRAQFRAINLHWHDLRHEYASRLVERGVPLAQVRDLLGHASITTTERYDNQKLENLQAAAARLEAGEVFAPPTPTIDVKPVAKTSHKTKTPVKSAPAPAQADESRTPGGIVVRGGLKLVQLGGDGVVHDRRSARADRTGPLVKRDRPPRFE